MASDIVNLFTRPRTEQRSASGAYLPVLARVEVDGTTRSFQVLQIYSQQYGRVQVDCALDGSLHLVGTGGGVGEFSIVCLDGPIIDCHVREGAKTAKQFLGDFFDLFTYGGDRRFWGRQLKKLGRAIEKAWTTNISDDPYKTESPLQYYVSDTSSIKKRRAKIYIYSKFGSWQASDVNDKSLTTMLDSNKQDVTGVFDGVVKDVRVDSPGSSGNSDVVMTTITLVGTWTKA